MFSVYFLLFFGVSVGLGVVGYIRFGPFPAPAGWIVVVLLGLSIGSVCGWQWSSFIPSVMTVDGAGVRGRIMAEDRLVPWDDLLIRPNALKADGTVVFSIRGGGWFVLPKVSARLLLGLEWARGMDVPQRVARRLLGS